MAACPSSEQPPLLLEDVEDAVVLVDPRLPGFRIANASGGFARLTGRSSEELIGDAVSSMLRDVPLVAISRSAQKNFEDFCKACLIQGVTNIAESWHIHPYSRKDGSIFNSLVMLGFCRTRLGPYVIIAHKHLNEGVVANRVPPLQIEQLCEQAREVIKRACLCLSSQEASDTELAQGSEGAASAPGGFFARRLSDRSMLFKDGRSAARREPAELPIGCLLFGGTPMTPTPGQGLRFSVRIDEVKGVHFKGLPVVGFTRRPPHDTPDTYPTVSKCLGHSVLIGGMGEATARDKYENFKVGFRKIPESEVASWGAGAKEPAFALQAHDIVECRYLPEGLLQFWVNGVKMLDYDVGRPLEAEGLYWPVVDVAFSVSAVTLLDEASASAGKGDTLGRGETLCKGEASCKAESAAGRVPTIGNLSTLAPTQYMEDVASVSAESIGSLDGEMGTDCRERTAAELEQDLDEEHFKQEEASWRGDLPVEHAASPVSAPSRALIACAAAATAAVLVVATRRTVRRSTS